MRDKTPDVREWPLRIVASLLTYAIFTALLTVVSPQQWDARVKMFPADTEMALTVARLSVNCTRFLFNLCTGLRAPGQKPLPRLTGVLKRTGQR